MRGRNRGLGRRIDALAPSRLGLPAGVQSAWLRASQRLRRAGPSSGAARKAVVTLLVVASTAASIGLGYVISDSLTGGGDTTPSATRTSVSTTEPSPDTAPAEEPVTTRSPLTELAQGCRSLPLGTVAPYLAMTGLTLDTATDPRRQVAVPRAGITTAESITPSQGKAPFSITAVVLPAGATPASAGAPIDRAGTTQLWIVWDGAQLHKGIRTWDGRAWRMADEKDPASDALTIALEGNTAKFFSQELAAGARVGFVTADAGGCATQALDAAGRPTQLVAR